MITSRGARGKGPVGAVVTGAMLTVGVAQAMRIMRRFRPDLVFGTGGYASVAAVSAARLMRKTVVLQEQNSIPGLANRMLAPMAARIYLGFEKAAAYFGSGAEVMFTGNPLRRAIRPRRSASARDDFGLSRGGLLLFVFGGSQGAMTLSRAAAEYITRRTDIQAIVQTGEGGYEEIRDMLSGASGRVFVSPFIEDIAKAYAAADFALARAGALTVSELAAAALPSVLVPYPHCADDHQRHNASVLVEAGGAVMLEDSELDADSLAEALDPMIGDPALLERMSAALAPLATPGATAAIADDVERLAGGEAA